MTTTPKKTIDLSCLRKIVELGKGKSGSVALYGDDSKVEGRGVVPLHAVKRVRRRFCIVSPSAARRVLQEKNALQALKGHPGIVDLRCTSKDDENLYFVLEPLLGGPLHRHIRAGPNGSLEVPTARFYASEIISAIAHMHGRNLMHRDLKASNVVLCTHGHAKLIDLGSSKHVKVLQSKKGNYYNDWEKSYTYCGTPHCMAPEMISKEGHTPAVDWWALGILIHEMLTATPPFGYHGGEDLQRRITAGIPSRRGSSEANEGGKEEEREMMHSDTKRTDGEAILATDYLPVVRRLLDTDPRHRLGSDRGADEVMSHAWFESIDWEKIAQQLRLEPPPFLKDLGELEALEGKEKNAQDASSTFEDPFAGF